jgi:hypothetical protein
MFFYIKNKLKDDPIYRELILIPIMITGFIQLIFGILQWIHLVPNIYDYRIGGSFGNPGDLANFIILFYVITLGLLLFEKKNKIKYIYLVLFTLILLLIILSLSRAAWMACIGSSLLLIYYKWSISRNINLKNLINKYNKFLIIELFISVCLIGLFFLYNFKKNSADGRFLIWKLCLSLIYKRPIFGHGYESILSYLRYEQINFFKNNFSDLNDGLLAGEPVFAFNDFLQITIEFGIIALLLWLFLFYKVLTIKFINQFDKLGLKQLFICKCAIVAILICMLFSYPMQNPTIFISLFIFLATLSIYDQNYFISFRINKFNIFIISSILMAFSFIMLYHSSNSFNYGLKWKHAFRDFQNNKGDYVKKYNELSKSLYFDRSFILNYGSILYKTENYQKCICLYERFGYLCSSTNMYLMLGESYEKVKDYSKAEENYKNASLLIPHLFKPKFKLFKLYLMNGQLRKADSIAFVISNMKIKVFSNDVKTIKTEINKYLILK